jgi:hypothetical protein
MDKPREPERGIASRPCGKQASIAGGRLLRLATACPYCGARPGLRVTDQMVEDTRRHPPDQRLGTYQCQRRKCGEVYELTAAAYQNAS